MIERQAVTTSDLPASSDKSPRGDKEGGKNE